MEQQHMFTNRMIRNLLVPVVLEQILNSIMGTADTMMVSNVGSAALSAVHPAPIYPKPDVHIFGASGS